MPSLSREAILTVLSGLTLWGCDKAPAASAEPPVSASAAPSAADVAAKEVPAAAGKAGEKAQSCAPGGCAPGKCGGSGKK